MTATVSRPRLLAGRRRLLGRPPGPSAVGSARVHGSKTHGKAEMFIVGAGEMRLVQGPGQVLATPPIGTGIAVALYEGGARVAGILHFILPDSEVAPRRALDNPALFADTGIPAFLRAAAALGASRTQIRLALAGGAQPLDPTDFFAIGMRNQAMARRTVTESGLSITREHVGGTSTRAIRLSSDEGHIRLIYRGRESEL